MDKLNAKVEFLGVEKAKVTLLDGTVVYLKPNRNALGDGITYNSYVQPNGLRYVLTVVDGSYGLRAHSAVEEGNVPCNRCGGTGIFRWGAIVDGVSSKSGPCYHCKGKGKQNKSDQIRNRNYIPKLKSH